MKTSHRTLIWTTLLFAAFAMLLGTFCYFLGKTDTLGGAFSEFLGFSYALLPGVLIVIALMIYDIRRAGKKNTKK